MKAITAEELQRIKVKYCDEKERIEQINPSWCVRFVEIELDDSRHCTGYVEGNIYDDMDNDWSTFEFEEWTNTAEYETERKEAAADFRRDELVGN